MIVIKHKTTNNYWCYKDLTKEWIWVSDLKWAARFISKKEAMEIMIQQKYWHQLPSVQFIEVER